MGEGEGGANANRMAPVEKRLMVAADTGRKTADWTVGSQRVASKSAGRRAARRGIERWAANACPDWRSLLGCTSCGQH